MCRGWKGVVLVAACWCLNLPAQAQVGGTYPSPVGAARMPEPIPCNPSQGPPPPQMPNLIPIHADEAQALRALSGEQP